MKMMSVPDSGAALQPVSIVTMGSSGTDNRPKNELTDLTKSIILNLAGGASRLRSLRETPIT
jgi:hypothetical protein